jgi:hypothetical protein
MSQEHVLSLRIYIFFLLKPYQLGRGENTYLTVELKQKQKEEWTEMLTGKASITSHRTGLGLGSWHSTTNQIVAV